MTYSSDELKSGTVLDNYIIQSVLGRGAFGITYLAKDKHLERPVAIKEYLPSGFATRTQESTVHPKTEDDGDMFQYGLSSFLDEARTVVKFKHPNIVRVLAFFEANSTAYIVMEYEEGRDLKAYLKINQNPTEKRLLEIFIPINEGLNNIHQLGYIHRDIKPGNIYIRQNDTPVLIDFGAARDIFNKRADSLTRILTRGYAPYEQDNPTWANQGPWTDIYALGATLHFSITGECIVGAQERAGAFMTKMADPYQPLAERYRGKYSQHFLAAIDHALQFHPNNRPQNVSTWSDALQGKHCVANDATMISLAEEYPADQETLIQVSPPPPKPEPKTTSVAPQKTQKPPQTPQPVTSIPTQNQHFPKPRQLWKLSIGIVGVAIMSALGAYYYLAEPPRPLDSQTEIVTIFPPPPVSSNAAESSASSRNTQAVSQELIMAKTGNALLQAKTTAQYYLKSVLKQKFISDYKSLPSSMNRTKYIANLEIEINKLEQDFDNNFKQYADTMHIIRQYPTEAVKQAIRSLITDQYKNDPVYTALGEMLMQHSSPSSTDEQVWRDDLKTLSQKPGIFIQQ